MSLNDFERYVSFDYNRIEDVTNVSRFTVDIKSTRTYVFSQL